MSKAQLLRELDEENGQWEALLGRIGAARMDEPGVAGHWSVKDIVAHITSWRRRTVDRLMAAAAGEADPPPYWPAKLATDDDINDWFYERDQARPVEDVLEDSRRVFQQLRAAVDAFPEDDLMDPDRFPWLGGQPLTAAALFSHFHD